MTVQPEGLTKEGKIKEADVVDELQLDIVKAANHKPDTRTGGPRPAAKGLAKTVRY